MVFLVVFVGLVVAFVLWRRRRSTSAARPEAAFVTAPRAGRLGHRKDGML